MGQAGPPYRIHGDTWYVGTCGISAVLVTSEDGHVLIDTGTEGGADTVLANIRALGFDPEDVDILLHSHEHFDHTGGFAKVQRAAKARIIASVRAARVIGSGLVSKDDPQHGSHPPMQPASVTALIQDGETVTLGDSELTAIETPGHTPGALSWSWRSCEGEECVTIVYADSLSPVSSDGYAFGEHAEYIAGYRQGLGRLATLDCDLLLTPHPSASRMVDRLAGKQPWIDPGACRAYAQAVEKRLDARLDKEDQRTQEDE